MLNPIPLNIPFTPHGKALAARRQLLDLSVNPKVQQNLHDEVKVLNINACSATEMDELKYLDAVIKETQRLNPVVAISMRLSRNDIHIGDYTIPKNSLIFLRYSKVFKYDERFGKMIGEMAPEKYCPYRWLDPVAK